MNGSVGAQGTLRVAAGWLRFVRELSFFLAHYVQSYGIRAAVIALCLLCALIGQCAGEQLATYSCLKVSTCSCQLVGLEGALGLIDLSPLKDKSLVAVDSDGYLYKYFPCEARNLGADSGTCDTENHVAFCQIQLNKTDTEEPIFTSCGNQSTAEFSVQSISPLSLQLSFSLGEFDSSREEFRSAKMELECNSSEEAIFSALGEYPTLAYNFKISSRYACPQQELAQQFPIGLMVILVLIFYAGVYLCVGSGVNACWLKKRGLEIIPNFRFWIEVPALIRDGLIFTLSLCYWPLARRIAARTQLQDSFERDYNRIE